MLDETGPGRWLLDDPRADAVFRPWVTLASVLSALLEILSERPAFRAALPAVAAGRGIDVAAAPWSPPPPGLVLGQGALGPGETPVPTVMTVAFGTGVPKRALLALRLTAAGPAEAWPDFLDALPAVTPRQVLADRDPALIGQLRRRYPRALLLAVPGGFWS